MECVWVNTDSLPRAQSPSGPPPPWHLRHPRALDTGHLWRPRRSLTLVCQHYYGTGLTCPLQWRLHVSLLVTLEMPKYASYCHICWNHVVSKKSVICRIKVQDWILVTLVTFHSAPGKGGQNMSPQTNKQTLGSEKLVDPSALPGTIHPPPPHKQASLFLPPNRQPQTFSPLCCLRFSALWSSTVTAADIFSPLWLLLFISTAECTQSGALSVQRSIHPTHQLIALSVQNHSMVIWNRTDQGSQGRASYSQVQAKNSQKM